MEEEEVEDMHVCLKCNSCIMGLENYVTHRKTQCSALQGGASASPTKAKISDIVQPKPVSPPATSTATATATSPANSKPAVSVNVTVSPQQLLRDFQQKAQAAKPSCSTVTELDLTDLENQFICPRCKIVFEKEQTFLVHIRGCVDIAWPNDKEDETPNDEDDGADPEEQTQTFQAYGANLDFRNVQPDGQFHCILCNYVNESQKHMQAHCRSKPHSQVVHEYVEKKLGRQFEFFERNADNMLFCQPCNWQAMYRMEMENHICQRLHQECIMNLAVPNYSIFGMGENNENPEGNGPRGIMDLDELGMEQFGISPRKEQTKKSLEQSKKDENALDLMLKACHVRGNDNKFTCEICTYSTDRDYDMKMHTYRLKHKQNVDMLRKQLARTGTIDLCIVSKWRKQPPREKKVKGQSTKLKHGAKKGRGRPRKHAKVAETQSSPKVKSQMKKIDITKPGGDDDDDFVQVGIPNTDQVLSYTSCEQVNIKMEPETLTQEIQGESGSDAKQDSEFATMQRSGRKRKANVKYVDDVDLSTDEKSLDSEDTLPEDSAMLPEATCAMEENAPSVTSEIPLERKRGRPGKIKYIDDVDVSNDEESVDSEDKPTENSAMLSEVTYSVEENVSSVTSGIPLKRGRGRPRKIESSDPPSSDVPLKRNVGRPRKYPVSAEPPSPEPPHRKMTSKRGRPRKYPVSADEPSPEPPHREITSKRGPGRPPKLPEGAEILPESPRHEMTFKRGRGRPRKYPKDAETLPESPNPEVTSETNVGKSRKRPKPDRTQRELNLFSNVEYMCEVCECDFVSVSRLREHYRTRQHTESCEELSSNGTELMHCTECPAAFINSDKYEIHIEKHRLNNKLQSKAQISHCDACLFSFLSKEVLVVHKEKYCKGRKSNQVESVEGAAPSESNVGQDDGGAIQISEQIIGEDVTPSLVTETMQGQEVTPLPSGRDEEKDGNDAENIGEVLEEEDTNDPEWTSKDEKVKKKSKGGRKDEKVKKKSKGRRIFACEMCEYYNTHMKGLLGHMETMTHEAKVCEVNGQEKTFQCVRCTEKFYTIRLLDAHLEKHVQAQQEFKICAFCGVMVQREEYKSHCLKVGHEELVQPKTGFKCNICDKVMRSASSLADHKYIHTGQKPHKCPMCSFCTRRKGDIKIHMKRHLGIRAFKCDQCDFTFVKKSTLARHLITHDKNRPHDIKCNVCDAAFFDTASLRIHRKNLHENDKPRFFCEVEGCTHGSKSKSEINSHMRSHTKEKPFLCTTCGVRTATPKAMRIHQRIHTGDKPYKCTYEGCSYAARFDSHLRRHLLVHTGVKPYKCPHCDYRSNIQENLRKHIKNSRKHKGMKMYKCSRCNEWEGDTLKDLMNHIRNDHGIYVKRLDVVNETGIFQKEVLLGTANAETEAESAEQSGDNIVDDARSSESNELSIMNVPLMQGDVTPNALGGYEHESNVELNVLPREGVEQHRVLINQAGLGAQVRTQQLVVKLEEKSRGPI